MFTQICGERITHMSDDTRREHDIDRDCWCNPTVERFNPKSGEWEVVQ